MNSLSGEVMYHIENPLRDGHSLRCFSSGSSLRVVRILAPEGQLVGYGEAPQFEFAISDAAENYVTGEDYAKQYRNNDARYPHATRGSQEVASLIDGELYRGAKLLARWSVDHVVAELHNLTHLPVWRDEFDKPDVLPTVVEQYGRTWLLEQGERPGWISVRTLSRPDGKDDGFADLVRVGEGETLDEAIAAALAATQTESPVDEFKGKPFPPGTAFKIHFDNE